MGEWEQITVKSEGYSLRRLIWERYQKPTPGLIEPILESNPGLARVAYEIPVGTSIKLPIIAPQSGGTDAPTVTLWE